MTTVTADGAGYRWTRQSGPDRRQPMVGPADAARALIGSVPEHGIRLTLPEPNGPIGELTFRTAGPASVAKALLFGGSLDVEAVATILRNTATTLSNLHAVVRPSTLRLPAPHWPGRLLTWLRTGLGPRDAGLLRDRARDVLGDWRLRRAADWCAALTTADGSAVPLHGAPGTGVIVPPEGDGDTCLLTGEELAVGRPECDLGHLVGEVLEFRHNAPLGLAKLPAWDWDRLIATVQDGYGPAFDRDGVGRAAALRVLRVRQGRGRNAAAGR